MVILAYNGRLKFFDAELILVAIKVSGYQLK